MGLTTKPVAQKDAARIAAIHRQCFAQSWSGKEFAELLKNPAVLGLVFLENDRDIGMALLQSIGSETEILTFGIIPARRAKGFGYDILRGISHQAQTLGSRAIVLEVSSNNQVARNLYTGFGFEKIGVRKRYYADQSDALICRLQLSTVRL